MSNHNKTIGMSTLIIAILLFQALITTATVQLVSPENNTYLNHQDITFDYYISLDNLTDCKLIADSTIKATQTNLTNPGFNQFIDALGQKNHTWSITCDTLNNSETSEERTLTVDFMEPTIVLFFPLNNSEIGTSTVNISFVILDNIAENIPCDLFLNNTLNQSFIVNNSEPTSILLTGLSNSTYEWEITCRDDANNSQTSETRTFRINIQPPPPVSFNITIPKTEYVLGELGLMTITAPDGTSIRVEVCPDKIGFVECKVPVNAQNVMNYPFQEYLPFTGYEGKYVLEATFNYTNKSEVQTLRYEVKNNIDVTVDVNEKQRRNVPVILEAQAVGGVGTLNYTWRLSNGSVINQKKINITYGTSGNYTNTILVKDSYNNTMNKSILLQVEDVYTINIFVKDSVTGTVLKDATIDIKGEEKDTDTNGEATYYLRPGLPDIYVLRENYTAYNKELNITKDDTFTILLDPENKNKPVVTLLTPTNNATIRGPENNLIFKAEYNSALNCSVYINENNTGFFNYIGSMDVASSSDQIFGVMGLENKTYYWNVECVDKSGNRGLSNTWAFTAGEEQLSPIEESANSNAYDAWINEFGMIIDSLNSLPKEEKDAADALGLISLIEESITTFRNTIRDVDALRYRTDLSDEQKQAEGERLVQAAEEAYKKTPVKMDITGSSLLIDYIKNDELGELLKEYLAINNSKEKIDEKGVLKALNELQQEAIISTNLKNVKITFRDGSQSDASIIIRDIKTYNLTEAAFILEVIPKDIAQSSDEILSTQSYEVVKKDPIIKFNLKGDMTLMYYFNLTIDVESLKRIKTAVFQEPSTIKPENKVTGFSVKNLKLPGITSSLFLPIIIIVILGGLVFAGARYDGVAHAKHAYYKLQGRKSLHYISVVLNEIKDNLDAGDIVKAVSLYEEAKGAYTDLPNMAKNDIYESVLETANQIQNYYDVVENQNSTNEIREMIARIQNMLSIGQLMNAIEEYKQIESAYNQFDDSTKEMLHPTLVEIGNKIQIMIENAQNLR